MNCRSNKKMVMTKTKMLHWRSWDSLFPALLMIISLQISLGAFVDKNPNFKDTSGPLSNLHSRCEGACYYFDENGSDENGKCTEDSEGTLAINCEAILSISKFTPRCGDLALTSETQIICDEAQDHTVYKLTIGRRVKATDCNQNDVSACKSRVFVGAAFSKDTQPARDVPYFICSSNNRSPVETWVIRADGSTERVTQTTPFENLAVTMLSSTLAESRGEESLVCTFYLSSQKYSYNVGADSITFDFLEDGLNVQLVRGLLSRNDRTNSVDKVFIGGKSCKSVISPCPVPTIWTASKPIDLKIIDDKSPKPRKPRAVADPAANADGLKAMAAIHEDCLALKRFCYVFSHERGCLHKEMCHILLAIQADKDFKKLHFDIISHVVDLPHIVKHVRPSGWTSFAFSNDQRMGDDFVVTCGYYGTKLQVYITINLEGTNLYDKNQTYQDLLLNKEYKVGKKEEELEPRVMCSFDLDNLTIEISKLPFVKGTMEFDLVNSSWYMLLAQGPTVTETWSISKHTHKEVILKKFSKEFYEKELNGSSRERSNPYSWLQTLALVFILFFK